MEKQKANQTDIAEESVEFEQEDVYVDMVECAAHQISSEDSCGNGNEREVDPVNKIKQDAQEYAVEENTEENVEEHVEYNSPENILDMTDDYCLLLPADNLSRSFRTDNTCLQDETYKTDKQAEWCSSDYSSEHKGDWQNPKCDQNSKCSFENVHVPMLVHSITEDLPSKEDYEYLTAVLPPEPDLSVQQGNNQEERTDDNEDMYQGELNEYSDEGNHPEHDEEPLVVASTEDDVYIVFETSVKNKQRGQTSFTSYNPAPPEATSDSTIASGASYNAQGERTDDNKNISHSELDEYSDRGNDPEHDEEPLVVASTEDDVYLVFETSVKNKQRGQTPINSYNPAPPEAASDSTIGSGASYIAQAKEKDERFSPQLFWDKYEDNEEDPYSIIYNDDDELYIELPYETADEENPRERKSFIVHRAPAPAPRPQTAVPDIEDSYISRVFRQKEEEKKIYSTGLYQADKTQLAKHEPQIPAQQYALSGQDELILLQEKVKMGIISMDEALQKFQQWQNEKSGLDLLQQKKLQQLRDNIIGDKTDDEKVYDRITIVHQPNAFPVKKKTAYGMFDNSIYQKPHKPAHSSAPYHPIKKDNETAGKLPHTK